MFKTINTRGFSFMVSILLFFGFSQMVSANTASSEEDPVFTQEVEVVGDVPVVNTIQSVTIIRNEEIEDFNFESLKSVLQLTPGLLTLSNGGFGQSASTSIRGSKNTQVLYIIDGVKLRDGAGIGGVNLAFLSPNLINKMEVVRGPLSNIYGSDAMGGVISMNTQAKTGTNFSASFGSHSSYMGNFSGTISKKNLNLGLTLSSQRYSDNIENDIFKNTGLSAKAQYSNDILSAGFNLFGNITDSGIPTNLGVSTPQRQYKQNYFILAIPVTYRFSQDQKVEAQFAYTGSIYTFNDPEDMWSPYFRSKFSNYEAEVSYSGTYFEKLNVKSGIDYAQQRVLNEDSFVKTLDNVKMYYLSGFLALAADLDPFQISISGRYDRYKDVTGNFSPQFGVSYLINHRMKVRAAYSRSFLAPVAAQQVNPWGAPNFDLKPEKGKSYEMGIEYYSSRLMLSATYFNTEYKDMIDWVTIDWVTYRGQYRNITNVDTHGLELAATVKPFHRVTVGAAYSYLHTNDPATGKPLIRRPKHTFSASATYTGRKLTLAASTVYVGRRGDLDYTAWPPETEAPAFNTYDFSLIVPINRAVDVYGKISNAFDLSYEELIGYPAPGRRFEFGFKYKTRNL